MFVKKTVIIKDFTSIVVQLRSLGFFVRSLHDAKVAAKTDISRITREYSRLWSSWYRLNSAVLSDKSDTQWDRIPGEKFLRRDIMQCLAPFMKGLRGRVIYKKKGKLRSCRVSYFCPWCWVRNLVLSARSIYNETVPH